MDDPPKKLRDRKPILQQGDHDDQRSQQAGSDTSTAAQAGDTPSKQSPHIFRDWASI